MKGARLNSQRSTHASVTSPKCASLCHLYPVVALILTANKVYQWMDTENVNQVVLDCFEGKHVLFGCHSKNEWPCLYLTG